MSRAHQPPSRARSRGIPSLAVALALVAAGCRATPPAADPGTQISMSFDRSDDFYAAPFPSDDLVQADGSIAIAGFPDPAAVPIVEQSKQLIAGTARGFAQTGGVYFELSGDLDPTQLPTLAGSIQPGATAFLIGVQQAAPDYLKRYPVKVVEAANSSPFGPVHLLSMLPLQGLPLRPAAVYAAVVLRSALDINGKALGRTLQMAQLADGVCPANLSSTICTLYIDAIHTLSGQGISSDSIAGLAVFTTDSPQAGFAAVVKDMLARPLPTPGPFTLVATYSGDTPAGSYCEFQSTVQIPDYQFGTPPFTSTGGYWVFTDAGAPVLQRMETANVYVTIPQAGMPDGGYPAVVFIPTGGGTALPLVDRGVEAGANDTPIAPGNGPAMEYAKVGFAGMSIDGPEDGLRNTTGNPAAEDSLMFNFLNPPALRDNVREDGAEVVLHAHILANLTLDATGCPGAVTASGSRMVHFDSTRFVVSGHSMGATVAPLPAAYEPLYKAMIVDGAGASYIENIMFKQLPFPILPVAELDLGYLSISLLETDPVLSLVQWAAEPSDSQVFARNIVQEPLAGAAPRHVLMFQGIVDHYILPTIANSLTLALGLDLAGAELDTSNPAYTAQDTPIGQVLGLAGRRELALPASGNFGATTAVLTQDPGDGFEDGHEMVFQTEAPKNQYRCFLQTLAAGGAPVLIDGSRGTCP